jgi:spore coat protein H
MTYPLASRLFIALSILGLSACGGGDTTPTDSDDFFVAPIVGDVSEDIFDAARLIQVTVDMPDVHFSQMREEGRTLSSVMSGCPASDFDYTDFSANVNIDGELIQNVAIRKKGFLGSISSARPSLKLNFDTHVDGRTFKGMKRMTLNNDRQDPSHSHQCMAYDMFRAAGLVAPRCNLARVTVNGEDLGIYSQVESIKKPFLERNFGDKGGNLYEAQVADFGEHLNDKFELKTNKTLNDRSDLAVLSDLLKNESLSEDEFITMLGGVIDLPEFIRFWAVEALIGHWDSATGNVNNFYIYHDPTDGLFHFIPWGTDSAFTGKNPFKANSGPLYRNLSIAARLFDIASTRQQYFDAINDVLLHHWNEDELLAKLDRLQAISLASDDAVKPMKTFIAGDDSLSVISQRELLQSAMLGNVAQTVYLLPDELSNCVEPQVTTNLVANFESKSPFDAGSFTFINEVGTQITASMDILALAPGVVKPDALIQSLNEASEPSVVGITLVGAGPAPFYLNSYVLQVLVETPDYVVGDHDFVGIATNVLLFKVLDANSTPVRLQLISAGSTGTINLTAAGDGINSAISGSINAKMGHITEPQNAQ